MKTNLRKRAIRLRKNGWSYNIIRDRLGVSKSTLSLWLRDIPYVPNEAVRKRIRNGPAKAAEVFNRRQRKRTAIIKQEAAEEIGVLSKRDLFILGVGLYIGEGGKSKSQGLWEFHLWCRIASQNYGLD